MVVVSKKLMFSVILILLGSVIGVAFAFLFLEHGITGYAVLPAGEFNIVYLMAVLFILSIVILKFVK